MVRRVADLAEDLRDARPRLASCCSSSTRISVSIRTFSRPIRSVAPSADGLLVDLLEDLVDVAPPAGVILVELPPLVDDLQAEDVALIELERAEGERFELAGAEGVVGAELLRGSGRSPGGRASRPS